MSEQESEDFLFHSITSKIIRTKISVKLLPNGYLFVDWSDLPKYRKTRQYVIHYKSLNTNRVISNLFYSIFEGFFFKINLESCYTCITCS